MVPAGSTTATSEAPTSELLGSELGARLAAAESEAVRLRAENDRLEAENSDLRLDQRYGLVWEPVVGNEIVPARLVDVPELAVRAEVNTHTHSRDLLARQR